MNISYSKNYINIYFWQGISILLNLLSLLVVVPHISRQPEIYGIYAICISVALFLSYVDLGFVSAGFKYASESFARNDREEEIKIIGFVSFILLVFISIYFVAILALAFYPEYLIKDLKSQEARSVATGLLTIQAFSSVIIIAQRCVQIIYGIRLEDFLYQRILIAGNALKIASVFYFFQDQHYDITGYYFFVQLVNLAGLLFGLRLARKRYQYDLRLFFRSVRFSREIYGKTKQLAFGAFLLTLAWILYYELDSFAIARLSGARAVAYYAIGFTILSFYRSLFGTLFNPLNARFNHYVGVNDLEGLRSFFLHTISITLPLVVFPILALLMLMRPFVFSWVGPTYEESILLAKLLILGNIFGFISYPTGFIVLALHKVKLLNIVSFIYPLLFWGGILVTYQWWGITSFAFFKLMAFLAAAVIYMFFAVNFLKVHPGHFLRTVILPALPGVVFICGLSLLAPFLPHEKGKVSMLITVGAGAIGCFGSCVLYMLFSKPFRQYMFSLYAKVIKPGAK